MESENGVALEDEKCVVVEKNYVEESAVDSNKEGKNADLLGEKVSSINGNSEPAKVNDGLDSSSAGVKASVTAPPSKNSKTAKVMLTKSTFTLSC